MVALSPCSRCPRRATCDWKRVIHARVKLGLSGVRLTAAKVSCAQYRALYVIGDRVKAAIKSGRSGYSEVIGTVIGTKGAKFRLQLDNESAEDNTGFCDQDGENSTSVRYFIKVYPDRMEKLDEPRRNVCACGNVQDSSGCCILPVKTSVCWYPNKRDQETQELK